MVYSKGSMHGWGNYTRSPSTNNAILYCSKFDDGGDDGESYEGATVQLRSSLMAGWIYQGLKGVDRPRVDRLGGGLTEM